jgi:glycosyltransferase involved in cell wall biosynthesis
MSVRVGIIAPPWVPVPPPAYGGTEAVIDRLARGLLAAGDDVLLWTTGDSTCPVERRHVLERAETDRMGIAAIELRHLIRGYEAMADWGADIVHDHTLIGPVYAHRYPALPVVTTNHGTFNEELTDLYQAIADHVPVIAISHDQAARAGDLPIAAVIHHGIDLDRFPFGDGTGDDDGPYFLFLGRMAPEKGARRAAVAARKAGVRLVIAAKMQEPWEREFYEQQIRPLLTDDVTYVGEVGGDDKIRLLQGATALVNPIRWPEPFGLVMIEALACGTPVLAYREGSTPEIVDHGVTGFLCDDVDDLASRLGEAHLLDRDVCRGVAERRFSTARMVDEHLALFERVLADRTRPETCS